MLWFTKDWTLPRQAGSSRAAGYSISLPPGTYHLQFVDQRAGVRHQEVRADRRQGDGPRERPPTVKNVTMQKGATITGTVQQRQRQAGRAASRSRPPTPASSPFSTTANDKGQFAIGGLPQGKYSVFTYDTAKNWVTQEHLGRASSPARPRTSRCGSKKRAGSLTVVPLHRHRGPLERTDLRHRHQQGRPASAGPRTAPARKRASSRASTWGKYNDRRSRRRRLARARPGPVQNGVREERPDGLRQLPPDQARRLGDRHRRRRRRQPRHRSPDATVRLYDKAGNEIDETTSGSDRHVHPGRAAPDPDRDDDRGSALARTPTSCGDEPQPLSVRRHRGHSGLSVTQGKETAIGPGRPRPQGRPGPAPAVRPAPTRSDASR